MVGPIAKWKHGASGFNPSFSWLTTSIHDGWAIPNGCTWYLDWEWTRNPCPLATKCFMTLPVWIATTLPYLKTLQRMCLNGLSCAHVQNPMGTEGSSSHWAWLESWWVSAYLEGQGDRRKYRPVQIEAWNPWSMHQVLCWPPSDFSHKTWMFWVHPRALKPWV